MSSGRASFWQSALTQMPPIGAGLTLFEKLRRILLSAEVFRLFAGSRYFRSFRFFGPLGRIDLTSTLVKSIFQSTLSSKFGLEPDRPLT